MEEAELPLEGAGARLLRAREAAGLSRAQIAGMTRIPERHLAAIEAGNFAALPARTYAVGFSRSYAKALGLDSEEIVGMVREELAAQEQVEPRRTVQTFEPGDPARVPGSRLVWLSLLGIALVVVAGLVFARSMFAPGGSLPTILAEETAAPVQAEAAAPAPAPAGPVVFTALEPKVWVKFTDGSGNQLMQDEMAQGETWTVPADQAEVKIWTARPDALSITIGGQAVPKLSDVQKTVKDVPVTAAALLARGTAQASPAPEASVAPTPAPRAAAPVRQRERRPAAQPAATPTAAPTPAAEPAPAPAAPAAAAT